MVQFSPAGDWSGNTVQMWFPSVHSHSVGVNSNNYSLHHQKSRIRVGRAYLDPLGHIKGAVNPVIVLTRS